MSGRSKNILFISLLKIRNLEKRGIYPDLIRYMMGKGHHVTLLSPVERRDKSPVEIIKGEGYTNIRYKSFNNTQTNNVEKLLSTLTMDLLIKRAIKKNITWNIDLLICATPPITLTRTIRYVKSKYGVPSYLLLKDIFPDNVADLDLISKKSLLFKYFKRIERNLYNISDHIGCMSPANVNYLKTQHPEIPQEKIEVNPNTITAIEPEYSLNIKTELREKYNIKPESLVFFYGGNLGKPQMIDFLIEVMEENLNNKDIHFFIVGAGTEYPRIEKMILSLQPKNITLLSFVPKSEYDNLISIADIGLILLDKRFNIPNFPSRILSYMENYLPVLLATDINTDIGTISVQNGFGLWSEAGDVKSINSNIQKFVEMDYDNRKKMGLLGNKFLKEKYDVRISYELIMEKCN